MLVVSCETLPIIRNTFNVPILNDSDVSLMLFISSRQSTGLKRVQQTLIIRSRDKSLGGKLFHMSFFISNFSDQIEVIITNTYIHLTNNYKYYNYLLSRVILPSIIQVVNEINGYVTTITLGTSLLIYPLYYNML